MARETLATGIVPLAGSLALPGAVVRAYQDWVEQQAETQDPTAPVTPYARQSAQLRYRRPQLCLDPWGQGLYWRLPAQYLAPGPALSVAWELISGDTAVSLPVRLYSESGRWRTEEQFAIVPAPPGATCARFLVATTVQREWQLDEFPVRTHYPFFAFSPETGELLLRQEALRARPTWLLLAPGLQVAHARLVTEQLPQLPGDWSAWRLLEVDLSTTNTLVVTADSENLAFPVVTTIEPTLAGTLLHLGPQPSPIYSRTPPALQFPRSTRSSLSGWHIDLYQEQPGSALRLYHGPLAELKQDLLNDAGGLILPLSLPGLLGEEPFGQYRVRVRNPLDDITEFRFAVVSHLTIAGNEQLYLPAPEIGAQVVTLLVEVDAATRLMALDAEPTLSITDLEANDQSHLYEVTLAPGAVQAQLTLQRTPIDAPPVDVPLVLAVRRLRWSLLLKPTTLDWSDGQITCSLQELEESLEPSFFVDLPLWQEAPPDLALCFIDEQGDTLLKLANARLLRNSTVWRFDLRTVATRLRHTPAASVRVRLVITGIESKPLEQPVLHIRRSLHLDLLTTEATWSAGTAQLTTRWSPNPMVRSRALHVWSLTRPWQPAISLALPDTACGQATHTLAAADLPPGRYQVTICIDDPWLPQPPAPYPPAEAHTVTFGSLTDRIDALSTPAFADNAAFEQRLERALIHQLLADAAGVDQDVIWCAQHLHWGAWQHRRLLLETFSGHLQVKLLRFRLLDSTLLQAALRDQQHGLLNPEDWRWLRQELLTLVPQAQLSADCGALLLQFHDRQLNLATARRLFDLSLPLGVTAVVSLLRATEIDLPEAVSILQTNLRFALHQLALQPPSPVLDQLLCAVEHTHPAAIANYFIRTGYWVHCQAGWGRLEQIQSLDGTRSTYLSLSQLYSGARLHITLRAGTPAAEQVILDMANQRVIFAGASTIYRCAKCQVWATARQEALYYEHNSRIHGGIHSAIALTGDGALTQTFEPAFSVTMPDDIWR